MKKWLVYGGLVLTGVIFADRIRTLPMLGKLPTF